MHVDNMGCLFLVSCVALIMINQCSGHTDRSNIKKKIGDFVQKAQWKPQGWKADVDGTMLLSVLQKYKVPLQTTLTGKGKFPNTKPRSCSQVIPRKQDSNKTYTIYPDGRTGISVYCDMNTDGGGWTVIQQRFNGELNFNRNWKDYKEGFGVALHNKEYWLGNEYLHILTMKGNCTLRVDVVTRKGDPGYALYQNFSVGPESEAYKLRIGKYSGTAGESGWSGLTHQNGMGFSTPDRDNDLYKNNCASDYKAGFWYKACFNVNLNTPYGGSAFIWYQWKKSGKREYLKRSKMMLRC